MSLCNTYYCQIRYEDGKKRLFHPIVKRRFEYRPEEYVRLSWVEMLIHRCGWSKHRIITEQPVARIGKARDRRADIVVYNDDLTPYAVIECKRPSVSLSEITAVQVAQYNQVIRAPYVIVTNGEQDIAFHIGESSVEQVNIENIFPQKTLPPTHSFVYWRDRGFIGGKLDPHCHAILLKHLQTLFYATKDGRFIHFEKNLDQVNLSMVYKMTDIEGFRLQWGFSGNESGATHLVAIVQKDGKTLGVLDVHFDTLLAHLTPDTFWYGYQSVKKCSLSPYFGDRNSFEFSANPSFFPRALVNLLTHELL